MALSLSEPIPGDEKQNSPEIVNKGQSNKLG